jgi:hypothetical protein
MTSEARTQPSGDAALTSPLILQPEKNAHGVVVAAPASATPVRIPDNLLPRVLASSLCATNDY